MCRDESRWIAKTLTLSMSSTDAIGMDVQGSFLLELPNLMSKTNRKSKNASSLTILKSSRYGNAHSVTSSYQIPAVCLGFTVQSRPPVNAREAIFGGRTNPSFLNHKCNPARAEKTLYMDFTSVHLSTVVYVSYKSLPNYQFYVHDSFVLPEDNTSTHVSSFDCY